MTLVSNGSDWIVLDKCRGICHLLTREINLENEIIIDNVFHNIYSHYIIEINIKNYNGTGSFTNKFQLRKNGATIEAPYYTGSGFTTDSSIITNSHGLSTSWLNPISYFQMQNSGDFATIFIEITNPQSYNFPISFSCKGSHTTNLSSYNTAFYNGSYLDLSQTADGFIVTCTSGKLTGNVKVFQRVN